MPGHNQSQEPLNYLNSYLSSYLALEKLSSVHRPGKFLCRDAFIWECGVGEVEEGICFRSQFPCSEPSVRSQHRYVLCTAACELETCGKDLGKKSLPAGTSPQLSDLSMSPCRVTRAMSLCLDRVVQVARLCWAVTNKTRASL